MRKSLQAAIALLVLAYVAVIAYKTGRGDSWDIEHAAVTWSQRARAAEEALDAANAELVQCVLDRNRHIIFPRDTTEALTLAPGARQ